MWHALREQFIRRFAIGSAMPAQPSEAARDERAREVAGLQEDVTRLQRAIADLCRAEPGLASDASGHNAQLRALQAELDATQRALARFQGRI
jgi:hypothetical protein